MHTPVFWFAFEHMHRIWPHETSCENPRPNVCSRFVYIYNHYIYTWWNNVAMCSGMRCSGEEQQKRIYTFTYINKHMYIYTCTYIIYDRNLCQDSCRKLFEWVQKVRFYWSQKHHFRLTWHICSGKNTSQIRRDYFAQAKWQVHTRPMCSISKSLLLFLCKKKQHIHIFTYVYVCICIYIYIYMYIYI